MDINEKFQPRVDSEMATNKVPYFLQILLNISLNLCKTSEQPLFSNVSLFVRPVKMLILTSLL